MLKKILTMSLSFILVIGLLAGCGNKKEEDETKVKYKKDKFTNMVILTEDKSVDKNIYDVAESEVLNNRHRTTKDSKIRVLINHKVLPKKFEKHSIEKVLKEIEKDKKVNVLLVSTKQEGITKYIKELKKKRKDIIYISSNVNDSDKDRIKTYDLNFTSAYLNRGKKIGNIAKSLGAKKFIYLASKADLEKKGNKELLEEIEGTCKKNNLPIEGVELSQVEVPKKRIELANKIDDLISKYGSEVAIYTFDKEMDQVLAIKVLDEEFYIPEFARPNSSLFLMDEYKLPCITRKKFVFGWLNSNIKNFYRVNYSLDKRVATLNADPDLFGIQFGVELGKYMNSKREKMSKAYNSYFLEKMARFKCGVATGFINKYKGVGNFKLIDPDQIVY